MKRKRPWSVTWLALGVLSLVAVYLTRFGTTVSQWDFLSRLPLSISPFYLAVTGLIWGLSALPLVWGLWRGKEWSHKAMRVYSLLFTLYYWLEEWLIESNPLRNTNWPFLLTLTVVLLILVFWTISRPKARNFFGEKNERKPKN
jgi:H+/Cl- antiporter ClcA